MQQSLCLRTSAYSYGFLVNSRDSTDLLFNVRLPLFGNNYQNGSLSTGSTRIWCSSRCRCMDCGGGWNMPGMAFGRNARCTDVLGSYFYHGGLPVLSTFTCHVDGSLLFQGWRNSIHAKTWAVFAVDGSLALNFFCKWYNCSWLRKAFVDVRMFLTLTLSL